MLLIRSANLEDFDKVWPGSVSRLKGWFIFSQKFLEFFPSHVCLNLKAFQLFLAYRFAGFTPRFPVFSHILGLLVLSSLINRHLGFQFFPARQVYWFYPFRVSSFSLISSGLLVLSHINGLFFPFRFIRFPVFLP